MTFEEYCKKNNIDRDDWKKPIDWDSVNSHNHLDMTIRFWMQRADKDFNRLKNLKNTHPKL